MPTTSRWQTFPEKIDEIHTTDLMHRLGTEVADDMRRFVPKDKHILVTGIDLAYVSDKLARITSIRPGGGGGHGPSQAQYEEEVPYFVEFGTHHSRAQPYMRPAVYRKRHP